MTDWFTQIQQLGIFTFVRESTPAYAGLLWLHIVAVITWGGALLGSELVWGTESSLRRVRHVSLGLALIAGLLLFGAKAGEYAHNPWFWGKLLLLAALGAVNGFRRGNPRLAGVLTVLLMASAIAAARGPATVKDVMDSMVDPNADFLFESVQILSDEKGITEIVPRTDAEWQEVGSRAEVLLRAQDVLSTPGLRGGRPRDRAANPSVENEAAEVQRLLEANPADFARRAHALGDASKIVQRAVANKDKDALLQALEGIDRACESCHVTYWYPRDQRAREAAKAAGIIE